MENWREGKTTYYKYNDADNMILAASSSISTNWHNYNRLGRQQQL